MFICRVFYEAMRIDDALSNQGINIGHCFGVNMYYQAIFLLPSGNIYVELSWLRILKIV
jgi:hypothetical protein